MRIINTRELIEINNYAVANYNRCLDPALLAERVDPEGLHVLTLMMIHEHSAGVLVDPHFRCLALIKLRGEVLPQEAALDIEMDTYQALPGTNADASPVLSDFVKSWNATL